LGKEKKRLKKIDVVGACTTKTLQTGKRITLKGKGLPRDGLNGPQDIARKNKGTLLSREGSRS